MIPLGRDPLLGIVRALWCATLVELLDTTPHSHSHTLTRRCTQERTRAQGERHGRHHAHASCLRQPAQDAPRLGHGHTDAVHLGP